MKKYLMEQVNTFNVEFFNSICSELKDDQYWFEYFTQAISKSFSPIGIHLAIFIEPFLTYILDNKKTVESRFGIKRGVPYGRIFSGDIILLKKSGGPIMGICEVANAWFYKLNSDSLNKIRNEYAELLCANDPSFWNARKDASYATLIQIKSVKIIKAVNFEKSDRRGWVILRSHIEDGFEMK